jgi:hypothetical protein
LGLFDDFDDTGAWVGDEVLLELFDDFDETGLLVTGPGITGALVGALVGAYVGRAPTLR